jgi:hypothetical protein
MEFTDEMLKNVVVPGKGMPFYLDQHPPRIEDPSRPREDHHWLPACDRTNKLTRCLEAVRDVATALAPVTAAAQPDLDKRLVKQLITPIYNLATALRDLYNYVQSNCWTRLKGPEQRTLKNAFQAFTKTVPTGKGVLKTARDKIAAHLDKDVFTSQYRQFWDSFGIADVLGWIRGCIRMMALLMDPDIYSWTRSSGYSNVVNLMNVDGSEVSLLIKDDKPECIVGIQFATSPKSGIAKEVREVLLSCSAICKRLGINEGTTWKLPE